MEKAAEESRPGARSPQISIRKEETEMRAAGWEGGENTKE